MADLHVWQLAIGLAAVLGMMLGVIVTLASFAVSAVLARGAVGILVDSQLPLPVKCGLD